MADETLTILLRIDASTKAAQAELARLRGEQDKTGDSATKMADKQDSAFQKAKKSFTEFNSAMEIGRKVFGFLGDSADAFAAKNKESAAEWTKASKDWNQALGSVKEAIGGLVVQMAPLISALSKAVDLAAGLLSNVAGSVKAAQLAVLKERYGATWQAGFDEVGRLTRQAANRYDYSDAPMPGWDKVNLGANYGPQAPGRSGGGSGGGGYDAGGYTQLGPLISGRDQFRGGVGNFSGGLGANTGIETNVSLEQLTGAQSNAAAMAAQFKSDSQQSYLESIFGPVDQFDVYAEGFNILSGAMQGAFDAWVDGSLSAGDAMKKFFSDAIKGAASQMFAEAIKHGAWAIGDLAFGNLPGAAMHAKAAAAFGAGALAVGGIARQLGGSGGGGSGGGGVGASGGANLGGGGSSGGGQQSVTIILGDFMSDDNPRSRAGQVARAIRSARKEMDDENGVSFS